MREGSARSIGNREFVYSVFLREISVRLESITHSVLFFLNIIFATGPRPKAA